MHAVYISENKLKEMLTFLISHGFVEEVKTLHWRDKRIITSYKCTTKGEKTVSYLEQYEVFLEEMDLEELIKEKYSHME